MLEVIDKGAGSKAHPVPLLFVHGSWHGAWCWDEHFLDYLRRQGHLPAYCGRPCALHSTTLCHSSKSTPH
jgi:hypothetical protein